MYTIKEKPEDFIVNEIINLKLSKDGQYAYFKLTKRDCNTEKAVMEIAEILEVGRNRISYCGAKDKVAVTTQYISVENLTSNKRKDYKHKDITLTYEGQGNEPLSLGSHNKNEFIIVVKEVTTKPKEDFDIKRIPNLFGPQRFSKNNHLVGKHLIKKEFKKAVSLILENFGRQEDNIRDYLINNETDFIGGLRTLPKKILSLYIHAYQSMLFNEMTKTYLKNNSETDNIELPLIGFATNPDDYQDYLVDDILDKEEIDCRDFIIKQIPNLTSEGDKRLIFMQVKNYECKKINETTYKIKFSLGKGSYATVFVDWLFE